ncbi:MAG: DUF4339 domain-containing protein [Gemmataceae bacterium]|nr:DUF4339 domain-containing protein [Gemmataceae bacterium]
MAVEWFYAQDKKRHGPYTAQRLKELARAGCVIPTDTVWLNNEGPGVLASKVKHLFDPAPAPMPAAAALAVAVEPHAPAGEAVRRKRAAAVEGVVVLGQDDKIVRFKKFCTKCRHEDSSWATMPIMLGTMRAHFFCPRCRKNREVLLRGSMD